ncbi:HlyD family secretion protein [Shewanella intestini]|uniref:HlyD family secretion protein n=1 Tax=Shewanella intestini TaxID=2017544 RepID=A0ABS5I0C4_9GAMM|nr:MULTISPECIES: efflux RND transporter periplasmic adaptor subunit [Shewanella]MBR9727489.1 HlyD family secretion protein [Shewanella intestini]
MNNNENNNAKTREQAAVTDIHLHAVNEGEPRPTQPKLGLWIGFIIALGIMLLVSQVVSQRYVPLSELGQVNGTISGVTSQVSGKIMKVNVQLYDYVNKGDVIAQIDPAPYQSALKNAELAVTSAGKNMGALSKNVRLANVAVAQAKADFEAAKVAQNTTLDKVTNGELPQARAQTAKSDFADAAAVLAQAQTMLLAAKDKFAAEADSNNNVKSALLDLEQAQLNLQQTNLITAKDGIITELDITVGETISSQEPVVKYLGADDIWIDVLFTENQLGNIHAGNKVEFALAFAPGQVLSGHVASINYTVNTNLAIKPSVESNQLRYFPVKVNVAAGVSQQLLNVGGQADVIVYTSENSLFNTIGHWWIKLKSVLSYVR